MIDIEPIRLDEHYNCGVCGCSHYTYSEAKNCCFHLSSKQIAQIKYDRFKKVNGQVGTGQSTGYIMLVALGKFEEADELLKIMKKESSWVKYYFDGVDE